MYSISFCTAIRNRLHHLRQTLPRNIADNEAYPDLEFVILDYNSGDGLAEWMQEAMGVHLASGRVVYRRTTEPAYFHRSHSRNLAFRAGRGELVCNVDADNFTGSGFAAYIDGMFRRDPGIFLSAFSPDRPHQPDFLGRICCTRRDFDRVGGYNEALEGYGFEDYELISRLRAAGLREVVIAENHFFRAIPHDDRARIAEEKTFNALAAVFLSRVTPSTTDLLYLFKDGTFGEGRLVDQTTRHAHRPEHALSPEKHEYEFTLEKPAWTRGTWQQRGQEIVLAYAGGGTAPMQRLASGELRRDGQVFTQTDDAKLITDLVMFYTQFTNRQWIRKADFVPGAPPGLQAGRGAGAATPAAEAWYRKLRVSVFYAREDWHLLLSHLVQPLMAAVKARDAQATALVHLGEYRGPNVSITWLLSAGVADDCARYVHGAIGAFLEAHPSRSPSPGPDSHATFKNFAPNTIAFNLYPYPFFEARLLDTTDFVFLSTRLTAVINEVLTGNEVDRDAAFTLAFYLHALLIKSFSQHLGESADGVLALRTQAGSAMEAGVNAAFADNQALFAEIIAELNDDDFLQAPANGWMLNWLRTCREVIKRKNADPQTAAGNASLLGEMSQLIGEHLALNALVGDAIITFIGRMTTTQPLTP